MKKKTIIILLVLTLSIYASNINVQITAEEHNNRLTSLELTPHESIEIISDDNFTDYGFTGTGTAEDPYIIEGLEIITTEYTGIYIYDTTKYFIVRNCYVDATYDGIFIDNVADGTTTVSNNTCSNNVYDGIKLDFSISSTISNNTCSNNNYGIKLLCSGISTVTNNTCSNNNYNGIFLRFSGSSTVSNNTFTSCGLDIYEDTIDDYLSYTVENNWVNGKKLGYHTNLDSTIIDEPVYGQLILINCTNVTVRDQILNNAITGLFLRSCTYSVIINNTCSNNWLGFSLSSSVSSTVSNNTCTNNNIGILLSSSSSSTVADNTCSNNDYGIYLSYSVSSTVSNNTCSNNNRGISFLYSGVSTVANNTCNNNCLGLFLDSSGRSTVSNNMCNNNSDIGIYLWDSINSTVSNNTCCNNNNYGIYLSSSDFCVVTYNLLQENEKYGVYSSSISDNILIHHNTFVDNNLGGTSQAYDNGANNYWYDTETQEGNYWSDWSEIGSYSVDGSANSEDFYPLDEPTVEYSVVSTTDENQLNFTFTLIMLIVPLLLTRIISNKIKKKSMVLLR